MDFFLKSKWRIGGNDWSTKGFWRSPALIALSFLIFFPLTVHAAYGEISFGGNILYLDPGSAPPYYCPAHIVFFDKKSMTFFGLLNAPGSLIYDYGNLSAPDTNLLGEHDTLPVPCARYYPLYRIFEVGTSGF